MQRCEIADSAPGHAAAERRDYNLSRIFAFVIQPKSARDGLGNSADALWKFCVDTIYAFAGAAD